jgi:hypothetical protein
VKLPGNSRPHSTIRADMAGPRVLHLHFSPCEEFDGRVHV